MRQPLLVFGLLYLLSFSLGLDWSHDENEKKSPLSSPHLRFFASVNSYPPAPSHGFAASNGDQDLPPAVSRPNLAYVLLIPAIRNES